MRRAMWFLTRSCSGFPVMPPHSMLCHFISAGRIQHSSSLSLSSSVLSKHFFVTFIQDATSQLDGAISMLTLCAHTFRICAFIVGSQSRETLVSKRLTLVLQKQMLKRRSEFKGSRFNIPANKQPWPKTVFDFW